MKKKIFTLLTLLLCVCSGAWGQYYTPTSDEVIILNDVFDSERSSSGYSTHSGVVFYASDQATGSIKCGDPYNGGEETTDAVTAYYIKNNGNKKQIDLKISGVVKLTLYHRKRDGYFPRLIITPSEGKNEILNGNSGTLYNDFYLDAEKSYTIRLHLRFMPSS